MEKGHPEVLFLLGLVTAMEGGTSVRRGGLLFKWPHKSTKTVTRSQCRGFS